MVLSVDGALIPSASRRRSNLPEFSSFA